MSTHKTKINHNGEISENATFNQGNRAFQYGDALFETIRMVEGRMPFLQDHASRLGEGMTYLGFEGKYEKSFLQNEIKKLTGNLKNARIRLQVYRAEGGLYTPQNNKTSFLISYSALVDSQFLWNEKGLKVGFYEEEYLPRTFLSRLKTSNSLPYILAARYRQKMNWDDCLLFNDKKNIAEASSSNIFLVKNGKVRTPSKTQGCVLGVMRKQIIQLLKKNKIKIQEGAITKQEILAADEIFLTNAIQGIKWIKQIENRQYTNKLAQKLLVKLNEKFITFS